MARRFSYIASFITSIIAIYLDSVIESATDF